MEVENSNRWTLTKENIPRNDNIVLSSMNLVEKPQKLTDNLKIMYQTTKIQARSIVICHLNIRNMRNKTPKFEVLLQTLDYPHIVCVTETHYKEHEITQINLNPYILADYYCRSSSGGEGVAIFVRQGLNFIVREFSIKKEESCFEYALIEINLNTDKHIKIGMYL